MKINQSILLLSILVLAGCNSSFTPVSIPASSRPDATVTPVPTKDTSTPALTQDAAAAEHSIISTAIVQDILSAEQPKLYKSYPSPDGKWQVDVSIYDCIHVDANPDADANAFEQLELIEAGSGEKKQVDAQLQTCGGVGAAGLEGLYWSSNGRYFYYTDARDGMPDGCGYWEKPVLRLDVYGLQIERLGSGPLSPDGTKLITWQGNELVIWDVDEGRELGRLSAYILNTDTGTGNIAWSPDSKAFVYVQPESYCPLSGKSQIVHVDVSTLEQTILLESEAPTFGEASWDTPNEIKLFDETGAGWIYHPDSKELKPSP